MYSNQSKRGNNKLRSSKCGGVNQRCSESNNRLLVNDVLAPRRPLAEVPGSSGRAAGEERVIAALLNTSGRVGGQSYYDWHILQHVCCCFATGRPTDRRATLDSCDMMTSAREIVVVVFFRY